MAEYFNGKEILPAELVSEVMEYIPERSRNGALVYLSEDYYARRNGEIVRSFRIYQADPTFGSRLEIYEALSEHYRLTVRRICKIVKENGEDSGGHARVRRRFSGLRVDPRSRRMKASAQPTRQGTARRGARSLSRPPTSIRQD